MHRRYGNDTIFRSGEPQRIFRSADAIEAQKGFHMAALRPAGAAEYPMQSLVLAAGNDQV